MIIFSFLIVYLFVLINCKDPNIKLKINYAFINSILLNLPLTCNMKESYVKTEFNIMRHNFIPNGSNKDVFLTIAFNKFSNLYPLLNSYRSTGTQARFVFISDQYSFSKLPQKYVEELNKFNIEFILFPGKFNYSNKVVFIRFHIIEVFLRNNNFIDRIINADLFDTIIQYDPFTTNFSKNYFYISEEYQIMDGDKYDTQWINEILPIYNSNLLRCKNLLEKNLTFEDFKNKHVICAGLMAGGYDHFLAFSELMFNMFKIENNSITNLANDQGFYNFFYYGGAFKNSGIQTKIMHYNSEFLATIGWIAYKDYFKKQKINNIGEICVEGNYPAIIHQYNRCHNIIKTIENAFYKKDIDIIDFIIPKYKKFIIF